MDGRMCDANWYLKHLEVRLFNRDAEGMLVERLGADEVRWAVESVINPSSIVSAAFDSIDRWTEKDLVLPTGPDLSDVPPEGSSEEFSVEDLKRCARLSQAIMLRNSFGLGLFKGMFYAVTCEVGSGGYRFDFEISLSFVLELLSSSTLSPDHLTISGTKPWTVCMERHISQLVRSGRVPIMDALRPIVQRHGFLRSPNAVLSKRRLRNAKRSMFLAGLMAAGVKPGSLLQENSEAPPAQEGPSAPSERGPRGHMEGQKALFHRTDEELEPLLGDDSMRDQVAEELEFRLRNNRLSRMLAHLKRISRGEGEGGGDDE